MSNYTLPFHILSVYQLQYYHSMYCLHLILKCVISNPQNQKMLQLFLDDMEMIFCLLYQPFALWLLKTVGKFPAH